MSRIKPVLFLLPFFLVHSPAWGKAPLSQALAKAQDQQFDFEDRKAADTLTAALAAFDKSAPDPEDLSRLAEAWLFLA
ncbi:MAG: hypothetical protein Q7T11_01990, partial [Deltaproteobacteria bacterium]|nr:hypothetical protein [Deltaproteobacteria bacterium]